LPRADAGKRNGVASEGRDWASAVNTYFLAFST
jgi:hypothetical protein